MLLLDSQELKKKVDTDETKKVKPVNKNLTF